MLRLFKVSTSTSKSKKLALLKHMSIICWSIGMSFLGIDDVTKFGAFVGEDHDKLFVILVS